MHKNFPYPTFCHNINQVQKYSTYYIIHNSKDTATKYSIIRLKLVKLSYLVGSVDRKNISFHMTCLLPTYWRLLPLSYLYSPTMLKSINITTNIAACLEILHTHTKKNLRWNNISWGILNLVFTPYYNSSARYSELVRPLFLLLDDFL